MPTTRHDASAHGVPIRILVLAAVLFHGVGGITFAQPLTLESQLALVRENEDTHAEIELLRRLLDRGPDDPEANQRLIALWLDVEDYDMAEAAVAAWKQAPAGLVARARAAALFHRDEQLAAAIDVLASRTAQDPRDTPTLDQLGEYLGLADRWPEQIQAMDSLLAVEPSASRFLIRANARRQTGDYPGAVRDARKAQSIEPDSTAVKNTLPGYERLGQALGAIEKATAQLAAHPDDVRVLLERGKQYLYGEIPHLALADAEAAEKVAPGSAYARVLKARALFALGQVSSAEALENFDVNVSAPLEETATTEAIIRCDLALEKDPKDIAALRTRSGWLNHDIAQYTLASADAEAVLALDPSDTEACLNALYASALRDRADDAAAWLVRIEQLQPPPSVLARAYATVSELFFRARKLPRALEFAEKSLGAKEGAAMWRFKAACLQRMGREAEASDANARASKLEKNR
jgi:tetratricopeptide (TPR) repeat protein